MKMILRTCMKYAIPFFVTISCTQPIILKNMNADAPGYFMYGKIPERYFYVDKAITEELELKWTYNTNGSHSHTSIIINNNHLYIPDLSGRIYVLDRTNGKMIGYEKFNGEISVAPVIYKLRIYFVINELEEPTSKFIVFDFINGKILAEDVIRGSVTNELIKLDDGIIITSEQGEIIKYDFVGMRKWSTHTKTTIQSSPCAHDEFIYCGNQLGELLVLSAKSGEIIFKEKITSSIEAGLTYDNGVLFVCDTNGKITAFDVNYKKTLWEYETGAKILSTPVFDDNNLFVGNLSGNIFSIDKKSGKKNWQLTTKGVINTTPLLTKTYLVQTVFNHKLYLINPIVGSIVKSYEYERRMKLTPVLYDSLLYIGTDRGIINAYKVNFIE